EDHRRAEGEFVDLHAERVGYGVGQGGGGAERAALADAPGAGGVVGRVLEVVELEPGQLGGRGHEVVGQRGGLQLPGVVVDVVLEEGAGDALGHRAGHLPL